MGQDGTHSLGQHLFASLLYSHHLIPRLPSRFSSLLSKKKIKRWGMNKIVYTSKNNARRKINSWVREKSKRG